MKLALTSLLAVLVFASSAHAGNYSQNFEAFPTGTTNLADGSAITASLPTNIGVFGTNRYLQLSTNSGANGRAAFLLPDLDSGTPVGAFSATWTQLVQGHFENASGGEGFSFNFGQLAGLTLSGAGYNQEDGFGTGLSVGVRTLSTGSPGFYLRVNGAVIATVTNVPLTQWGSLSTTFRAFEVTWNADTGLSLKVDGAAIFTNVPTRALRRRREIALRGARANRRQRSKSSDWTKSW
jgi:hypothetical protein